MTNRRRLSDDFVAALQSDWQQHGASALEKVRERSPSRYCQLAADMVPREMVVSEGNAYADCQSYADVVTKMLASLGATKVSAMMRDRGLREMERNAAAMRAIAGSIEAPPESATNRRARVAREQRQGIAACATV